MRRFLCCDITVIVPCEFAADVDTKELSRSDSLEGSAVGVVFRMLNLKICLSSWVVYGVTWFTSQGETCYRSANHISQIGERVQICEFQNSISDQTYDYLFVIVYSFILLKATFPPDL